MHPRTDKRITTEQRVAASGQCGAIEWALDARGRMPAREFYMGPDLDDTDRAKMYALFKKFADRWAIKNRDQFKNLQPNLFEFKSHQLRFLGDFHETRRHVFLISHAVRKKKDKLDKSDIEIARRVLKESHEHESQSA